MALLDFRRPRRGPTTATTARFVEGFSIEVMPRTAAKIEDFRPLLPAGTRVYIAHLEGTEIADMVATAARLRAEGFEPMPHFPARIIADTATLRDWIARYRGEADVREALLLAGGLDTPAGDFSDSMQLLRSGAFGEFRRLHVAGHPEGNRDIDPKGGTANVEAALRWKDDFARTTDAEMAIVTQFAFEAAPVIAWAESLQKAGIGLPVHIGIAGPAKLQTLLKFAAACGVGPSLRVLERRARDVTKLIQPFTPDDLVAKLAARAEGDPAFPIKSLHIFPLGGIKAAADWVSTVTAEAPARRTAE